MLANHPNDDDALGNDIIFPVKEKKYQQPPLSKKELLKKFLIGFLWIVAPIMIFRCSFFIGADYSDGVVVNFKELPTDEGHIYGTDVKFFTNNGRSEVTFLAAANLRVESGEIVKVIYKVNNPGNAFIYSFFGFWFNSILICLLLLLPWVGFLIVYYGYDY